MLALTLLGTALAQLILYRMLALHGSARLSLVTYLMPGFALLYGALLLDEELTLGDARRPRADPRRRRARVGRRPPAAARSGRTPGRDRRDPPRARRRPRVPRRALRRRGRASVPGRCGLRTTGDGIAAKIAQDPESGGAPRRRARRRARRRDGLGARQPAQPDRARQRARRAPALPRPPAGRRRRAAAAAPSDPRARLPPDRARDLRLQRACAAARGARQASSARASSGRRTRAATAGSTASLYALAAEDPGAEPLGRAEKGLDGSSHGGAGHEHDPVQRARHTSSRLSASRWPRTSPRRPARSRSRRCRLPPRRGRAPARAAVAPS